MPIPSIVTDNVEDEAKWWVTPVISHELNFSSIFIPVLGVLLSYIFFRLVVPRSLAGLQVAFPTGPKRYEVHTVTKDTEEATILLKYS